MMHRGSGQSSISGWRSLVLMLPLVAFPAAAPAAIVLLKSGGDGVRGVIVKSDESVIEVEVLVPGGGTTTMKIPRSTVEEIIPTVDKKRLAGLAPAKPQSYSLYAEELADKRNDLEARKVGIRLYLIAAHLDPKKLGRGSLLGMTRLARTADEERRFRAMVYLLDAAHDRSALQTPQRHVAGGSVQPDAKSYNTILKVTELIRAGDKRRAKLMIQRPQVRQALSKFNKVMKVRDLEGIAATRCRDCDRGKQKCSRCKGRGKIRFTGGRTRDCPRCSNGKSICTTCYGNPVQKGTSPADTFRLLSLELAVMRSLGAKTLTSAANANKKQKISAWSKIVRSKQLQAAPSLTLGTITEFDPKKSVYRGGKWVKP